MATIHLFWRGCCTAAVAVLALAAVSETVMAQQPVGPEFEIEGSVGATPHRVVTARDSVGNFVAVWRVSATGNPEASGIFARLYAADGTPRSDVISVGPAGSGREPAVAMDASGNFVIAWREFDPGGLLGVARNRFRAQRFAADGTPSGGILNVGSIRINNSFLLFADSAGPTVAMDADGNFLVAWRRFGGITLPLTGQNGRLGVITSSVRGRLYTAAGGIRRLEFGLRSDVPEIAFWSFQEPTPLVDSRAPAVAMNDDGHFVLAWTDRRVPEEPVVYVVRYRPLGGQQGQRIRVTPEGETGSDPSVAIAPGGAFAVAWRGLGSSDSREVRLQRYTAEGEPDGPAVVAGHGSPSHVAMAPGGAATLVWRNGASLINGRHFDAAGGEPGVPFVVTENVGRVLGPRIAKDGFGDFHVTWGFTDFDDNQSTAVRARLFEAP